MTKVSVGNVNEIKKAKQVFMLNNHSKIQINILYYYIVHLNH